MLRCFGCKSQKPSQAAGRGSWHPHLTGQRLGPMPAVPTPWDSKATCCSCLRPLPGCPGLPPRMLMLSPCHVGQWPASGPLAGAWVLPNQCGAGPGVGGPQRRASAPPVMGCGLGGAGPDLVLIRLCPPALESPNPAQQPPWASRPLPTRRPLRPSSPSPRCPLGGDPATRPEVGVSLAPLRGGWEDPPASRPPGRPPAGSEE